MQKYLLIVNSRLFIDLIIKREKKSASKLSYYLYHLYYLMIQKRANKLWQSGFIKLILDTPRERERRGCKEREKTMWMGRGRGRRKRRKMKMKIRRWGRRGKARGQGNKGSARKRR